MNKYLSYSRLQEFATCPRKVFYGKHPVSYPRLTRKPSLILGSAIHNTIADLHSQTDPETDQTFDLNFEMVESVPNAPPIDYGKRGRDYYVARGRKMAHGYWHLNSDIDLRSSERWFFLQIGGDMHIRGRFDQLIVQDGKLVIRELKSGMKPDVVALEYDPQTLIQALALKQGFVAVDTDIPYISESDEAYHVHDFEPDLTLGRFRCKACKLEAELLNRFPDKLIYYHLPSLIPTDRAIKAGNFTPRDNPEYAIEYNQEQIDSLISSLRTQFVTYQNCEASGVWPQTNSTGFMSPCKFCDFRMHCDDKRCCSIVGREVESDGE